MFVFDYTVDIKKNVHQKYIINYVFSIIPTMSKINFITLFIFIITCKCFTYFIDSCGYSVFTKMFINYNILNLNIDCKTTF